MTSTDHVHNRKYAWRAVPDWVQLGFALLLFAVAFIAPNAGASFINAVWGIVLALILGGLALWALAATRPLASALQAIPGILIFALPWMGGSAGGWAWFTWIIGVLALVTALWSYYSMPTSTKQ